ncbi:MAG TPA: undecaprenyl-diphosphatase UppP [Solirubrobacterales bacterium]|jgi:undecaprenyl-diphosphatase|nr:undecaprenyl-diphosphatase UppP [Solirubrobacterales bacterium]
MSNLEALLLGVVQGLTEFLPISSSGHLIVVPWLQDYTFLQQHEAFNKTFDVALHAGTLIAAIAYFRVEVMVLLRGFAEAVRQRAIRTDEQRLAVAIAIGTVPAVIAGGLGSSFIDEHLGEPWMIAIQLIVFGALLGYADRMPQRRRLRETSLRDGWYVGLAQVLALAPGTSRSGITITAARWLGLDRDSAARFSFLLLIPAVAGATLYKAASAVHQGLPSGVAEPMVVGTIAAAVSGYLAISFLLRLVRTSSYRPFVLYRYAAGVAILLIIATGLRPATF